MPLLITISNIKRLSNRNAHYYNKDNGNIAFFSNCKTGEHVLFYRVSSVNDFFVSL